MRLCYVRERERKIQSCGECVNEMNLKKKKAQLLSIFFVKIFVLCVR